MGAGEVRLEGPKDIAIQVEGSGGKVSHEHVAVEFGDCWLGRVEESSALRVHS